jgi:acetylornithine deacetylase/succinyl-diaminopimelate desuccinylase-like protein
MVELGVRGLPLEPEFKSGTTEAPVYQKAGMDTVIFGPGQAAGNIHKPNEHVSLADLHRCVEIYRDVVRRSCGG